jgi:hypothetical protein
MSGKAVKPELKTQVCCRQGADYGSPTISGHFHRFEGLSNAKPAFDSHRSEFCHNPTRVIKQPFSGRLHGAKGNCVRTDSVVPAYKAVEPCGTPGPERQDTGNAESPFHREQSGGLKPNAQPLEGAGRRMLRVRRIVNRAG